MEIVGPHEEILRLSAEFHSELSKVHSVNFFTPKTQSASLTALADPYVLAFLFLMMKEGKAVHVHGAVSVSLLRNLEEYMAIWQMWRPNVYQAVKITASKEVERNVHQSLASEALIAFSGGLDSCCMARRHVQKKVGRRSQNIMAGLFVHGFDIPLQDSDSFNRAKKKNEILTKSLQLELLTLATDYRNLPVDWNDSHGAAIAACLSLFSNRFQAGLIAASPPYDLPVTQAGSTPVADPFLSSGDFKIIHDGAELSRIDRAKVLLDWPEGLQQVRVCWKGNPPDQNCCSCDKCIRTLLEFRVLGVKPAAFAFDVTDAQIRSLRQLNFSAQAPLQRIVRMAKLAGLSNEAWLIALEETVGSTTQVPEMQLQTQALSRKDANERFLVQSFTSKIIDFSNFEGMDADLLWIEGKSNSNQTPEFMPGMPLTSHILSPLIQFPLAVRMKSEWAEKYAESLKKVTYPFDLYWLGMFTHAKIKVQVLSKHTCSPRIHYRIPEWLFDSFSIVGVEKERIQTFHSFFHDKHYTLGPLA